MEGEDVINLPSSCKSGSGSESGELRDLDDGSCQVDSLPKNPGTVDGEIKVVSLELNDSDSANPQSNLIVEQDVDNALVDNSSDMQISDEITETVRDEEKLDEISFVAHSESFTAEVKMDGSSSSVYTKKRRLEIKDGSPIQNHIMDAIASVKRPRMTFDDKQPSVHIVYNFLTRASKQKLEELLQKWSEWQAKHVSSSQDENEIIESGEETYFPALCVGAEKPSAVSFWIDKQTRNSYDKEFIPLDSNVVPLYDRGYTMGLTSTDGSSNLEGGPEIKDDASRCFNCGSYSHSLKQCPKPRDNAAVNAARKQRKMSKRNSNTNSRNAVRYYQNSQGGKYDDLKPGVLSAETRQLLGLKEFDPPPWLNRMREIGYPPGYLAVDDEDQPSGISIYADGETNEEEEDGEITPTPHVKQELKMTAEFPGINAPIPAEADEKLWAPGPSSSESFRSRSHHRSQYSSESGSRGHHHEQRYYGDLDDEGPPGVDTRISSSYPPRYGNYDSPYSFQSPRDHIPRPRSPTLGRSFSERGRRSPLVYEDFASHGSYGSTRYSPSDRRTPPRIHGSARHENEIDERLDNRYPDYSSWSSSHRHHRW
ncbi:PSP, proline-rich [Corchorus olitorius]|uniref:PSP, proline-rich n=1 Tax=Corchorus olitorius TaxID=93759 RepID=A0A1R3JIQ1_9ROSI|nr:PSP, proline-rich [Corchorus olitorius]